jgi:hypothetical protein
MPGLATSGIAMALVVLAACQSRDGYFGRVRKPTSRRLAVENVWEPSSLDVHGMVNYQDWSIADVLFSVVVRAHPVTLEPTADIATHYARNADATWYVFYLRGHPHPRGIKLPNTDDLREQFRTGRIAVDLARRHAAPPDSFQDRWSDGTPLTAHDFVYSWRRLYDPKTANPYAPSVPYVLHAADILAGKRPPRELGIRALDDWTLEISLAQPTDFLLSMIDAWPMFAVPRQAIEAAEARGDPRSWTQSGHIVTSGPFLLESWRPFESLTVRRNPNYWEAGLTGLDEVVFRPIGDNVISVNLDRSGAADTLLIPPNYIRTQRPMRDHGEMPQLRIFYIQFNTSRPPFDNVRLRSALNVATDKQQAAKLFGGGQRPARTLGVPALGYDPVTVNQKRFDVSAYDPGAARELLAMAGFPGGRRKDGQHLRPELIYATAFSMAPDLVETLRRQWFETFGEELVVNRLDSSLFYTALISGDYTGMAMADSSWLAEPATNMEMFLFGDNANGTYWKSAAFAAKLPEAKTTLDRATRLHDGGHVRDSHCFRFVRLHAEAVCKRAPGESALRVPVQIRLGGD